MSKRKANEEYVFTNHARTSRYQNSTKNHMQKLLNTDNEEKRKISKKLTEHVSEKKDCNKVVYICEYKKNEKN